MIAGEGKFSFTDFKNHTASLVKDANATISLCVQSIEKMFNGEEYLKIIDNDDLNAVLEILVKQEIAESACVIFES